MPSTRDLLPTLCLLPLVGCAGWPNYAHRDPDDRDLVEAPDDPRTLVDVAWTAEASDDASTPLGLAPRALALGDGLLVDGALTGAGWSDLATADTLDDEACPGSEGTRVPTDGGDYLGDVDVVVISVPEDAQLCATVAMTETAYGWDLLLAEVDACGIPVAYSPGAGDDALGYGLGGELGEWGAPVTGGTAYAVQLAAYYPNDLAVELTYTLGVSLVRPNAGGAPGLCPLLPEETP